MLASMDPDALSDLYMKLFTIFAHAVVFWHMSNLRIFLFQELRLWLFSDNSVNGLSGYPKDFGTFFLFISVRLILIVLTTETNVSMI